MAVLILLIRKDPAERMSETWAGPRSTNQIIGSHWILAIPSELKKKCPTVSHSVDNKPNQNLLFFHRFWSAYLWWNIVCECMTQFDLLIWPRFETFFVLDITRVCWFFQGQTLFLSNLFFLLSSFHNSNVAHTLVFWWVNRLFFLPLPLWTSPFFFKCSPIFAFESWIQSDDFNI